MRRFLCLALLVSLLAPTTIASADAADFCPPGRSPSFSGGFADLYSQVGDAMGQPVECEHTDSSSGDALQKTTTGLAFFRRATNTPIFTNGDEHWALTADGLVYWTSDSADPPDDATPVDATPPTIPPLAAKPTPSSPAPSSPAPSSPGPTTPPPASSPTASPPQSLADIAAKVTPSIVEVVTATTEGSGVRVAAGVLTNAHVVANAHSLQIAPSDGRTGSATVLKFDADKDLALLQTDLTLPVLDTELAAQQRQGDEVLVFGYPLGLRGDAGGQSTLTRGVLSATITDPQGRLLLQTDAALNPGNSGGAMVNLRGKLIGIPSYGLRAGGAQGVNFAIAYDTVQTFLASSAGPPAPPAATYQGDPRSIALQASDLGGYTLVTQDTSQVSLGFFKELFVVSPQGAADPQVAVYVIVEPTIAQADQDWKRVFGTPTDGYHAVSAPASGDVSYAESNGTVFWERTRIKNVLLGVAQGSRNYSNVSMDFVTQNLQKMVATVNAQAK